MVVTDTWRTFCFFPHLGIVLLLLFHMAIVLVTKLQIYTKAIYIEKK